MESSNISLIITTVLLAIVNHDFRFRLRFPTKVSKYPFDMLCRKRGHVDRQRLVRSLCTIINDHYQTLTIIINHTCSLITTIAIYISLIIINKPLLTIIIEHYSPLLIENLEGYETSSSTKELVCMRTSIFEPETARAWSPETTSNFLVDHGRLYGCGLILIIQKGQMNITTLRLVWSWQWEQLGFRLWTSTSEQPHVLTWVARTQERTGAYTRSSSQVCPGTGCKRCFPRANDIAPLVTRGDHGSFQRNFFPSMSL